MDYFSCLNHFTEDEFRCRCGCGACDMGKHFLRSLDMARHVAGIPFIINSGFRCVAWNDHVGGVRGSAHTKGLAADIVATTPRQRYHIIKALLYIGFRRIVVYPSKGFLHADMDESKPQDILTIK